MYKLAAYIGPAIHLDQFLLKPTGSLLTQATEPGGLQCSEYFADGFGIGWYAADGTPAIYANPLPIWSDTNLPYLARSLFGQLWLAEVRHAVTPFMASGVTIQPFFDQRLIFLHSGFLCHSGRLRRIIRDFLEPHIEAEIKGNNDSEHLFALIRHLLNDDAELSIETAMVAMFDLLAAWLGDTGSLLNIIVTEGERIYAARHAFNLECPSLYFNIDDEAFPEGQLVASERLTESEFWQPMPPHHLLILDPQQPPELLSL